MARQCNQVLSPCTQEAVPCTYPTLQLPQLGSAMKQVKKEKRIRVAALDDAEEVWKKYFEVFVDGSQPQKKVPVEEVAVEIDG